MTTWNYRLCKEVYSAGTQDEEIGLTIREVFYDEQGNISTYGVNPAVIYGNTAEEVKEVIEKMQQALNKEIIDLDRLV